MKTRDELLPDWFVKGYLPPAAESVNEPRTIEVLLDIRDLLLDIRTILAAAHPIDNSEEI